MLIFELCYFCGPHTYSTGVTLLDWLFGVLCHSNPCGLFTVKSYLYAHTRIHIYIYIYIYIYNLEANNLEVTLFLNQLLAV